MNYLEVHPATQAWWDQRDKCHACKHLVVSNFTIMRCKVAKQTMVLAGLRAAHAKRGIHRLHCIDARSEDGPCGPEARLFKAKE